jgi:hypothetical protein
MEERLENNRHFSRIFGLSSVGTRLHSQLLMSLAISEALLDWYWKFGVKRSGNYAIQVGDWTKSLYDINRRFILVQEAMQNTRPAFAIWGPSQTGKSTLVSAYMDQKAQFPRIEGEDGKGSALHWEGGEPAFFMAPKVDEKMGETIPPWVTVMNPFNGKKDASACLSRFVYGTTTPGSTGYFVKSARFPIEVKLVARCDLLQALARGYNTECLGPGQRKMRTEWTWEKLQNTLNKFLAEKGAAAKEPKRDAFELLYELYQILIDLEFAGLREFKLLRKEDNSNLENDLSFLFNNRQLLSDLRLVEEFSALVLWDGFKALTDFWQKMELARKKYEQVWAGKTIHCTHKVAALFLDMESCPVFFDRENATAKEGSRQRSIHEQVHKLAFKEEGGAIFIGISSEMSGATQFNFSPEDYAIFQGLVWELVVPLNPANLTDTPFTTFIKQSDLLDFPGVGNEQKNNVTQIDCDWVISADQQIAAEKNPNILNPEGEGENKRIGTPFSPQGYFVKVLKRGKTASIVSTYAKRMNVDGFNIFQNIDMHPPVNANQLITGVNTWWKSMVPNYFKRQEGPSPLPLNLALCWWASIVNEAPLNSTKVLENAKRIWEPLGVISAPDISNTFALNYYSIPRGFVRESRLEQGSVIYKTIKEEKVFQIQFRSQVSMASFESMVADKVTGGTNYFFQQLTVQAEAVRSNPERNRLELLRQEQDRKAKELLDLLFRDANLFPEPEIKDKRKIYLDKLDETITEALHGIQRKNGDPKIFKDPKDMEEGLRVLNYVLREALNISYNDLLMVPDDLDAINEQFIYSQYQKWIVSQMDRYRTVLRSKCSRLQRKGVPASKDEEEAPPIINLPAELLRECLEAMVTSVRPSEIDGDDGANTNQIAKWLTQLANYKSRAGGLRLADLRTHLSVKMTNLLLFEQMLKTVREVDSTRKVEKLSEPLRDCPSYRVFIQPFYENHIERLKLRQVKGMIRPDDIPGDKELVTVIEKYQIRRPETATAAAKQTKGI